MLLRGPHRDRRRRLGISRKKAIAPRDNVILEYGLFTGRLGRGRSFLLIPSNLKVRLPSDVLGLSILPFRAAEGVDDQRQGMQATADKIVERIQNTGPFEGLSDPAVIEALIDGLKRQIERLPARSSPDGDDPQSSDRIREILNAALDPFLVRTPDAYSVWLRPDDRDGLAVTHSASVPADTAHPRWQRGEGLVGWVWDTGRSAATWKLNRHEKFVAREGCKNESYVCAAVGGPGGPGGVLAIGSDAGFAIKHGDEAVVRAYAAMLALVVEAAAAPASNAPVSRAGLGGAVQDAADFGGKLLSRLPWP